MKCLQGLCHFTHGRMLGFSNTRSACITPMRFYLLIIKSTSQSNNQVYIIGCSLICRLQLNNQLIRYCKGPFHLEQRRSIYSEFTNELSSSVLLTYHSCTAVKRLYVCDERSIVIMHFFSLRWLCIFGQNGNTTSLYWSGKYCMATKTSSKNTAITPFVWWTTSYRH